MTEHTYEEHAERAEILSSWARTAASVPELWAHKSPQQTLSEIWATPETE